MSAAFNLAVEAGILIVLSIVIAFVGFFVGRALATKDYPATFERFESGNPPVGRGRGWFIMQYYPYLMIFMILEPLVIFLIFLLTGFRSFPFELFILAGLMIMIAIPAAYFANSQARVIENWKVEERS